MPLATPAEVTSTGAPVSWAVKPGYAGTLNAVITGVTAATETPFVLAQDPDETFVRRPTDRHVQHDVADPGRTR